jgi:hypothetical protein
MNFIFFFLSKDRAHWARSETVDQVNLSYEFYECFNCVALKNEH